ncbi:8486_t:CDS:2 [Racocetra fulgida]|uniref:8486_t:CDS:1 n=1 Tax=Racocetra fulgida TaxID=60492 RepID=A0A9N9ALE1_9GLOM|nr:8486_t:CDS:2 [Racocetra fulgida]
MAPKKKSTTSSSKKQKLADNGGDQRIEQQIEEIISDEEDNLEDDFSHKITSGMHYVSDLKYNLSNGLYLNLDGLNYSVDVHDSDDLNESTTQKTSHTAMPSTSTGKDNTTSTTKKTSRTATSSTSTGEVHYSDYGNESAKKTSHIATSSTSRGQGTATVLASLSNSTNENPTRNILYTAASSSSAEMVTSTATSHKDSEDDFERCDAFTELQNASNEFEVALWVAHHPNVLSLANTIYGVMKAKITDNKVSSNTTNSCNTILNRPEINKFNNYRNKFHVAISSLADDFSGTDELEEIPSIDELSDFVTEDVWRLVLQLHLKATDLPALKNEPEMYNKFSIFVYQAVRNVLIAQKNKKDTKNAIRKCDEITIDLKIPTKVGIVKTLPVRELINL